MGARTTLNLGLWFKATLTGDIAYPVGLECIASGVRLTPRDVIKLRNWLSASLPPPPGSDPDICACRDPEAEPPVCDCPKGERG